MGRVVSIKKDWDALMVEFPFLYAMGGGQNFGRIGGVGMNPYMFHFHLELGEVEHYFLRLQVRDCLISFLMRVIWNSWVPSKVSFFAWEACWGKILILDQLQRRWCMLVYRCFLCKVNEESINHILLHYCQDKVSLGSRSYVCLVLLLYCLPLLERVFWDDMDPSFLGQFGKRGIKGHLR
ncbi:hypothetical protein CK203_008270 [Vitis vinifera]|uniref:Reverse transcriptase zinc-binding domain-containing protein n=1 Tax=Vitis vinifera TaxID=29760 RepID=A0A438KNU5_VITVI|nr:hypothetical protein CK203_008270 [Vitis vinifera]